MKTNFILAAILCLCAGCANQPYILPNAPPTSVGGSIPNAPPTPTGRSIQTVKELSLSLSAGMSQQQVRDLLGNPSKTEMQTYPAYPPVALLFWSYDFYYSSGILAGEKAAWLELTFSEQSPGSPRLWVLDSWNWYD